MQWRCTLPRRRAQGPQCPTPPLCMGSCIGTSHPCFKCGTSERALVLCRISGCSGDRNHLQVLHCCCVGSPSPWVWCLAAPRWTMQSSSTPHTLETGRWAENQQHAPFLLLLFLAMGWPCAYQCWTFTFVPTLLFPSKRQRQIRTVIQAEPKPTLFSGIDCTLCLWSLVLGLVLDCMQPLGHNQEAKLTVLAAPNLLQPQHKPCSPGTQTTHEHRP